MLCPHAVHLARTNHCLLWLPPTLHVSQTVLSILNSLFPWLPRSICSVPGYPLTCTVVWDGFPEMAGSFQKSPFYLFYQLHEKQVRGEAAASRMRSLRGLVDVSSQPSALTKLLLLRICVCLSSGPLGQLTPVALFLIPSGPSPTDGFQFFTTGPSSLVPPVRQLLPQLR